MLCVCRVIYQVPGTSVLEYIRALASVVIYELSTFVARLFVSYVSLGAIQHDVSCIAIAESVVYSSSTAGVCLR